MSKVMLVLLVLLACLPLPALAAADLDGWQILRIWSVDRVAVVKSPEGELRLVREGDRLGERIKITGFDAGRIVLEQPGRWGRATLFVSIVDGRQQVERLERQPLSKSEVTGDPAPITVHAANTRQ